MSKYRGMFGVAIALAVVSGLAWAQAPGEAPQPGPEHKKLGYFVGKWKSEGEMKPNPFMPGGPFSGRESCEWFDGGFSVICRSEGSGPMGKMKGLGILGYSVEEQVYTYYGVDSSPMAMTSVPRGQVKGDTWTYTDESMMGGRMVKSRYVIQQSSPTSYTFRWEMVGEDGSWLTVMEGKVTKTS